MTVATCPVCGTQTDPGVVCTGCGTPVPDDAHAVPEESGQREYWESIQERLTRATAPKYRVTGLLGHGGMAGVFAADEPRLGRRVAMKVLSPALMVDAKLVERFMQEARTIARLSHPNIVAIHEVDERDGLHWFTMTYVPGRTLDQVMAEAAVPISVAVARAWLHQIGDALAFAHDHGIVHRDIKPGNVLLDLRGNAMVTDFGIAKVADSEQALTRTGLLIGTPTYMSPEQCYGGTIAGASDQYSLGVMLYALLTGRAPFTGSTLAVLQAHINESPRPIRELRPECPDNLAVSIHRMLDKRPEERWPSLAAALTAAGATPPGFDDPVRVRIQELAAGEKRPASKVTGTPAATVSSTTPREPIDATPDPDAGALPEKGDAEREERAKPVWRRRAAVIAGAATAAVILAVVLRTVPPADRGQPTEPSSEPQATQPVEPSPEPQAAQPSEVSSGESTSGVATGAETESTAVEPRASQPDAREASGAGGPLAEPVTAVNASILVAGDLPTNARVTATNGTGRMWQLSPQPTALVADRYVLEFHAPGYESERHEIVLSSGQTERWTPNARPVRTAEPTTAPPARDTEADQAAVGDAVQQFVAAFDRRDASVVLPLLPSRERETWRMLLESDDVTDFSATLSEATPARIEGDAAIVSFAVTVSYHNQNQSQRAVMPFTGNAERSTDGWRLVSLDSAR